MPVDTAKLLGETIREIRLQRGLTQKQVAELCDMERPYITDIEQGKKNASGRTLVLIAGALDILPAELFRRFSKKIMKEIARERRQR
jgi:transcriptional regulator with XRE-family HTH domain